MRWVLSGIFSWTIFELEADPEAGLDDDIVARCLCDVGDEYSAVKGRRETM